MSFEVLREKRPSCSVTAMVVVIVLSMILLGLGIAFAYLLLSGRGNDYLLGTLMAFEFLVAGVVILVYAKGFVAFRQVAEEREERLLW
jgi:hypothetical protein